MRNVEEIYPLSPTQEGMLFHSLSEPGTGVYVQQLGVQLEGRLESAAFRRAWEWVVERHNVLRSLFLWEDLPEWCQVVRGQVTLPWDQQDWREVSPGEQQRRLEGYLKEDRRRGFNLSHAPLMRVALIQVADERWQCLWTHHHMLFDGWSLGIILKEVFSAYRAFSKGHEPAHLPSRPYRDYIAWLQQQDETAAEKFWRERLQAVKAPTRILDAHYVSDPSGNEQEPYLEERVVLSPETTEAVKQFARQNHLTMHTVIQGAWAILLGRYSYEETVQFGTVTAGRSAGLAGMESMVGLFMNTLPVQIPLSGEENLVAWLIKLQENQAALYPFEHTPLVKIQEWSGIPRGTDFLESVVVYENYPLEESWWKGSLDLQVTNAQILERTHFPLTLIVRGHADLELKLLFDSRRSDRTTSQHILPHFQTLLQEMVANPFRKPADMSMLTDAERHRVVVEWNATERKNPQDECLHHLVEKQAQRTPNAVAEEYKDQQLTYRELNARANCLAHYLHRWGVGPESLVGLCMERSLDLVVAILGILKAGGAYVPLDTSYPWERVAFMVEDAQVSLILTQEGLRSIFREDDRRVVTLDTKGKEIAQESQRNPDVGTTPRNLAYVIYTSGSTGRPKGVAIEHRSAVGLLHWATEIYATEELMGVLAGTSIGFDLSVFELFVPLSCGGKIILAENVMKLLEMQTAGEVTLMNTVPSVMAEVLETGGLPDSVHTVNLAGEPLNQALVRRMYEHSGVRKIYDLYGPTEATTYSTFTLRNSEGVETIGRPIRNTQVYLLDRHMQPVPIGIPGELYLGGQGLARGYLNRPDLTAEQFLPNPFSPEPGAHLYRTGDVARYMADGNLQYLGRSDHQIKLRGFRIELGEIETVLGKHPALKEAIVVLQKDRTQEETERQHDDGNKANSVPPYKERESGTTRLVAYLLPHQGVHVHLPEIHQFLSQTFPEYMIPSALVPVEEFPRTATGKVDRRALPPFEWGQDLHGFVAPRSPIEEELAKIWQEVLGVDHLGSHDNFFELGGHSLLATQIVSRVRTVFQVDLPIPAVFEARTIARLAERIVDRQKAGHYCSRPPIVPLDRSGELPLSFSQERMWFLYHFEGRGVAYNVAMALRLTGDIHPDALSRSLNRLMDRHESLRTGFPSVDGRPVQVIASSFKMEMTRVDLQGLEEKEKEAQRIVAEEAQRPFDLAHPPLVRTTLIRLGEQEHVFLLTMHHIISDAWSLVVFVRELLALCENEVEGRPSTLPDLPIHYADFANWQREWMQGKELESQLTYWTTQLAGAPQVLELPTDRPRPAVQSFQGACEFLPIPPSLNDRVRAYSRREGVTEFMIFFAAFQVLLFRYTGQEDTLVGTPVANRNWLPIEGLIGSFVNTLVLRTHLTGNPSFRELVNRVRTMALDAYAHQDLPFERLVETMNPDRDLSRSPLIQVMFSVPNVPIPDLPLSNVTLDLFEFERGLSQFDLTWFIGETPQQERVTAIEFNTDLFDRNTIRRMARHYQTIVETMITDPDQRVADMPIVSDQDRRHILEEWNRTETPLPEDLCVHHLFEKQVRETPGALAVTCKDQHLTYRGLNDRANSLAHRLQAHGVGPEVLVGLCMNRSIDMVVGVLGILKAGGAYVPIDPAYPSSRQAFLLADSQVKILLTHRNVQAQREGPTRRRESDNGRGPSERESAQGTPEVLFLDEEVNEGHQEPSPAPLSEVGWENLAYVIYTSGSTGKPKGVMVTHRGLANYLHWCGKGYDMKNGNGTPLHSSLGFDLTITSLFPSLLAGKCVKVLDENAGEENLATLLGSQPQWSLTKVTPSHLDLLRHQVPADRLAGGTRTLILGGEALLGENLSPWRTHAPETRIINEYGPTETVVGCCVYEVPRDRPSHGPVPIGKPIPNMQMYVLDRNLQPVPIGVPGELYIGGMGVARGYWNRPDLTAEKFLPNPFSPKKGTFLYATGDRARYREDGNLEYLGRVDQQVKIRGHRIELGEVEAIIREHPGIREAVAMVREDSPNDKRLVVYTVPENPTAATTREALAYVKERVPDFMVPAAIVPLKELPLTAHGKVDRVALPLPPTDRSNVEGRFVGPRDPLEFKLVRVWEKILGVYPIGIKDNFFALGGYSLLAVRVFAQIEKTFGRTLPLALLFQAPTVEQLAQIIREKGWTPPWTSIMPVQVGGTNPPFYCVPGAGADVIALRDVANHLGPDQPFYGLQAQGLDSQEPFHTRVEEMAAYFVNQLRALQPEGPYMLGGHSFGGVVAFEMAQQLSQDGQEVALLALFDTPGPAYGLGEPAPQRESAPARLWRHMRTLCDLDPSEGMEYVSRRAKGWTMGKLLRMRKAIKKLICRVLVGTGQPLPTWLRGFYLLQFVAPAALRRYIPRIYPGPVTVFRVDPKYPDPSYGWGGFVEGGINIIDVPGVHVDLIKPPHAQALAKELSTCITQAMDAPKGMASTQR